MPDPRLPVDARGKLRIDAPTGRSLDLLADGDTLRLELPGWPEARAMMPRSLSGRARALERLGTVLSELGLVLSLESAGSPVLRLGHGISANWLGRLLGGPSANIPLSAIALVFRR
jgi:hypothetical protein